jgi:hypothetical protein
VIVNKGSFKTYLEEIGYITSEDPLKKLKEKSETLLREKRTREAEKPETLVREKAQKKITEWFEKNMQT